MKPINTFTVVPSLPAELDDLERVANNLHWAWNHEAIELFRRLDNYLWEATNHNPVLMLGIIDQAKLEAAANDQGFVAHLERVRRNLDEYLTTRSTWFQRIHEAKDERPLAAYFSAEFGLTECLEIFAGGLGVLAGDHLKSASDLGVPLIGVGILYQEGYFRQYLNEAGWQQEVHEDNDFYNLPVILERKADDSPLVIEVAFPGRSIFAQVWRAQVGRVPLYMLDTNIPANRSPADRDITDELYGGDNELRIKQEILLGIGGYRALEALGLEPSVYHLNEGHPAFVALERIRRVMDTHDLGFHEARELASAGMVFTTHTPVSAGHDYFAPGLVLHYLGDYARSLGLSEQEFLDLGREDPGNQQAPFCMTTLALRLVSHTNAVSRLHAETSRDMWKVLWPRVPKEEVPIGYVTNAVHFQSWISSEMNELYDRYLGPRWREEPADEEVWGRAEHIPASELWRTHERRRERLIVFAREHLRGQLERRGAPYAEVKAVDEVLDPEVLTIGFARRFATYKRATLLLRDTERLARIVNNPAGPVQILFAGKAHPQDRPGKEMIAQIVALAQQPRFRRRIVFLEDYGMIVASYMVQGCDAWLNTPQRPMEASGTSGMKAAANGGLNVSTLDGWWDEAYRPGVGWAIGRGETYQDLVYQDEVEADALYDLLERDIVPTFYARGSNGLPDRWIDYMRSSIAELNPFFNTHRMVRDYVERFYLPSARRYQKLEADTAVRAKELAAWKEHVRQEWPRIRVQRVGIELDGQPHVGEQLVARARVYLGSLTADDVMVEFWMGQLDASGEIVQAERTPMPSVGPAGGEGVYRFESNQVPCRRSGLQGYTVRVLPRHPNLVTPFLPGMITWAEPGVRDRER